MKKGITFEPGDEPKESDLSIFKDFDDHAGGENKSPPVTGVNSKLHNLSKYAINLTEKAHNGELDPVIGRDVEVRRILEVLGRKRKNNPLICGEAGVGKTAIIEALAQRISKGSVLPAILKDKQILKLRYELDVGWSSLSR